jgi:2',3'-cyclic-nucleotide 2'-phosphodiesterase (5'-nucleotidase family)
MPFDNRLARLKLTGAQLKRLIAANVTQDHGILSISGVRARVGCEQGSVVVVLTRTNGTPIEDDARLTVVTNDFLAMGGDGLLSSVKIDPASVQVDTTTSVRDALVTGLRKKRDGLRGDDPTLFDPKSPRIELPAALPLQCDADAEVAAPP